MAESGRSNCCVANIAIALITDILLDEEADIEDDDEDEVLFPALLEKTRENAVRTLGYGEETVPRYSTNEFRQHFRMSRETFECLVGMLQVCQEIPQNEGNRGRPPVSIDKHLLICLWVLGNGECLRSVADRFNVTRSTVLTCVRRTCSALVNNYATKIIKMPTGERIQEVLDGFHNMKRLPGVLGAVDGCHIPIKAPQFCPENYVNRKGFHSVLLQGVADHELLSINCFVGWPGSVHDARVLKNSPLGIAAENNTGEVFPEATYLLDDAVYPLKPWLITRLITPFRDNGRLTNEQKRFNKSFCGTRMVIERSFALLKGRFRKLKYMDMESVEQISSCVMAACVLHNVCILEGDDVHQFMEEPEDEVNGYNNIVPDVAGASAKRNYLMDVVLNH